MNHPKAGGKRANQGGKLLEEFAKALSLLDFEEVDYRQYVKLVAISPINDRRYLVKNYPYRTIYKTTGRREWFLSSTEWSGVVECKCQNASGSVDEKLPMLCFTLVECDCDSMILLYGGDHWDHGRGASAIEWMKSKACDIKRECGRTLLVFSLDEFIAWAKRTWPKKPFQETMGKWQ